jgi:energy-coupling factor transporter ATP-binding protein EcfA2
MDEIVKVEGLSFQYKRGSSPALKDISFTVQSGEFIGITGPAGAGKTTLLSCISGIIPHYYTGDLTGKITVDNLDIAESDFRQLANHIGTVFEDPDFQMVSISVEEEVAFGPENLGIPSAQIEERIQSALRQTRITELRNRAISTLSGGQKQRVAIAAVLSMHPKLLLLDDPTSELDPIGTHEVFAALRSLNREEGITVIIVSQNMERLVENSDRIFLLCDGQLILNDTPRKICMAQNTLENAGARVPEITDFAISLSSRLNVPLRQEDIPTNIDEGITFLRNIFQQAGVA